MIPSDHFVRYYNEVFKALEELGHDHLVRYWRELGRQRVEEWAETFRAGGLQACHDYWQRALEEENARVDLTLTEDYFELRMHRCPSLSKIRDNDATPCPLYCDHCMGWVEPLMQAAGLHAVMDMHSRDEPHCIMRVYKDKEKADRFAAEAVLVSRPYDEQADHPGSNRSERC